MTDVMIDTSDGRRCRRGSASWLSALVIVCVTAGAGWAAEKPEAPIDIGTQKQLFVDDHVVATTKNVYRILNQPVKHAATPLIELEPPQKVGGNELVIVSGSVIYDSQERLFKMWYEAANYAWTHNYVGYATSKDGLDWDLPELDVIDHPLGYPNLVFDRGGGEMAPGVFKDPVAKDPQRRYKMIYNGGKGVGIAFSPDGIHWTPVKDKRVAATSDSPNSVLWDPRLRKYVAHTRHNERNGAVANSLRQVRHSESDDFLNWTSPGVIMKADDQDPMSSRQFYNMEWMPYGDVYFGFISVYHVPGPGPWWDKVDVQLTFSRDGRTWQRAGDRQVFIPYGREPGAFDWAMVYCFQHPIVVGDEIWFYYAGFSGLHWATQRQEWQGGAVGLAKLRLDGFVSMDPGGRGTLTTKPLRMSGDRLVVNANATYSSIRVEILGADGKPIEGFSVKEADPITGDSVRHTATWNSNASVNALEGKPIVLRFHLDRCKLYSFAFGRGG